MKPVVFSFLFSFCPLCVGVAVGGSLFSRFIPGLKMYLINSLWLGFLFFAIIKWIYDWWSIRILAERDSGKRFLKNLIESLIFLVIYWGFIVVMFFLNGKSFKASHIYSFHAGFFASLMSYELYHFLFEKGIKIRFGSTVVPGFVLILLSVVYYFIS
jgi:hypothetical protein